MYLAVGCPVWKREWIIDLWFEHVERACDRAGLMPGYIILGDPRDETVAMISDLCEQRGRDLLLRWVEEAPDLSAQRQWNKERYERMVYLRNELLDEVRKEAPRYFLSLDSDILLHVDAVRALVETVQRFDAVGGKTFMAQSERHSPSYAHLMPQGNLYRPDHAGVLTVDVIMAIKLMTPQAYAIDYRYHTHGEDIGWSQACREAGLRLGWDGRVTSKHVMNLRMLEGVDERCGF